MAHAWILGELLESLLELLDYPFGLDRAEVLACVMRDATDPSAALGVRRSVRLFAFLRRLAGSELTGIQALGMASR